MSQPWPGRGYWSAEDPLGLAPVGTDPSSPQSLESRKERAKELLLTTQLTPLTIAAMAALSLETVGKIAQEISRG